PEPGRAPSRQWLEDVLSRILEPETFDWSLPADTIRKFVARRSPANYPELVDAVFAAFAQSQGKPRWGDKTPNNVLHLPLLSRLFPDAQFVHIVRDGREVAASLAEQSWWRSSAGEAARWWRECVDAGR